MFFYSLTHIIFVLGITVVNVLPQNINSTYFLKSFQKLCTYTILEVVTTYESKYVQVELAKARISVE